MIVVDTSAIIEALAGWPPNSRLLRRLVDDADLHAPHLIDVDFIHALRRLVASGAVTEDRAEDVRADFSDLSVVRYPHYPLASRMWALRHNLTACDAAFVALAEALAVPLVTCDGRLAAVAGVDVELFDRSQPRRQE